MASPTVNKQVIRDFYRAMNNRDVDGILQLYASDAMIEVFHTGPFAGKQAASREGLQLFFNAFTDIQFSVESMIAENDTVAAQITSKGKLADGSDYSNRYHNLYQLDDERIILFNEYPVY